MALSNDVCLEEEGLEALVAVGDGREPRGEVPRDEGESGLEPRSPPREEELEVPLLLGGDRGFNGCSGRNGCFPRGLRRLEESAGLFFSPMREERLLGVFFLSSLLGLLVRGEGRSFPRREPREEEEELGKGADGC